ncbi:hypothetical protein J3Q64DRAFT_1632028, partial [Phycomyces blakesleeanus]
SNTVAADFGTAYSGCSYLFGDNIKEISDITVWPKSDGFYYPKVPTAIYYESYTSKPIAWGHEAILKANMHNSTGHLITGFKLLLDTNNESTNILPHGLTAVQVISDYLREFHAYVHKQLKRELCTLYGTSKFRYCLTVPAIWDDKAKATMREAAILAGIVDRSDHPGRLMLTSEPEAAALYCEKICKHFNLTHGKRFMVCDAGGGTVDLIVFQIEEYAGIKSLREITKGSGGPCGSTFLDNRMRDILKRRFGSHADDNKRTIELIIKEFVSSKKPEFENEDVYFSVPAILNMGGHNMSRVGIHEGYLQVTAKQLREEVFDPVVDQVLSLISGQINQSQTKIDAIILVGGFGQSNYLSNRITDLFKSTVGSIYIPNRGEMAVTRGAVIFGVDPSRISHRILRRTYGLQTNTIFNYVLDADKRCYLVNGQVVCQDYFSVFVSKGESIDTNQCFTKQFCIYYPGILNLDMFAYDCSQETPRHVTSPGVCPVAKFAVEIPTLPNVKKGDKIGCTAKMYFGKTEIILEVVILGYAYVFTSAFDSH